MKDNQCNLQQVLPNIIAGFFTICESSSASPSAETTHFRKTHPKQTHDPNIWFSMAQTCNCGEPPKCCLVTPINHICGRVAGPPTPISFNTTITLNSGAKAAAKAIAAVAAPRGRGGRGAAGRGRGRRGGGRG